jgi:transcriptional regulator with XRE-family HTH domain
MAYPKRNDHTSKTFGDRLADTLRKKDMNYSDLARMVFGVSTDKNGYTVARNRQSIGRYIAGEQMPDPQTREKIVEALGVPYDELFPEVMPHERPGSGVVLTQVDKKMSRLRLEVVVPTSVALEIIKTISPYT